MILSLTKKDFKTHTSHHSVDYKNNKIDTFYLHLSGKKIRQTLREYIKKRLKNVLDGKPNEIFLGGNVN